MIIRIIYLFKDIMQFQLLFFNTQTTFDVNRILSSLIATYVLLQVFSPLPLKENINHGTVLLNENILVEK